MKNKHIHIDFKECGNGIDDFLEWELILKKDKCSIISAKSPRPGAPKKLMSTEYKIATNGEYAKLAEDSDFNICETYIIYFVETAKSIDLLDLRDKIECICQYYFNDDPVKKSNDDDLICEHDTITETNCSYFSVWNGKYPDCFKLTEQDKLEEKQREL
ncbi:MAG: hypothetical protein K6B41_12295 [Butyrivibrio sp.]|nr:hypothetical protein [Butyrivibrio sp.]